jgi:hypothetical protein
MRHWQKSFEDSLLLGIAAPAQITSSAGNEQLLGFSFRVNNDIEIQLTKKQRKYFFQYL